MSYIKNSKLNYIKIESKLKVLLTAPTLLNCYAAENTESVETGWDDPVHQGHLKVGRCLHVMLADASIQINQTIISVDTGIRQYDVRDIGSLRRL